MPAVLLDFSKVKVGGGLLVASATLHDIAKPETRRRYPWLEQVEIWISPMVRRNLSVPPETLPGTVAFKETVPSATAVLRRPRRDFAVRFTLFGPTYTGRLAKREITGFAEITMLVGPRELGLPPEPLTVRGVVSRFVKRRLTMRSDIWVTETSAVADLLSSSFGMSRDAIVVVPNRPHPLFLSQPIMSARGEGVSDGELHLAYPTRAYPHKNLAAIEATGNLLFEQTGKRLVVHTTLRDEEWSAMTPGARAWMRNAGESSAERVLEIYRSVDAVFFPSLLEASSVTPLEANALGIPLLASDRPFVRTSAEAAELFEPADPASIADALARFDRDKASAWRRAEATAIAYRRTLAASSRTDAYLDLVDGELKQLGEQD